jgi:thymidylate synthase (FAD)
MSTYPWLNQKIEVLDKGFVVLKDQLGSDLTPVNAARISFGKQKDSFDENDEKLIKYLVEHDHTSPFRHEQLQFHIKAPIFVLRQWMKYRIGSEFNEISGRYVEFSGDECYIPEVYRLQSKDNKQASEGRVKNQDGADGMFRQAIYNSVSQYKTLIGLGVCREQARCVLPLSLYSEVYWTVSLQAVCHFIQQRTDTHAQWEIQQYALAVSNLVKQAFPISSKYLLE